MGNQSDKSYRQMLASELESVADMLLRQGLIRSSGPLQSAAGRCRREKLKGGWEYDCTGLEFLLNDRHLGRYRNSVPPRLYALEIKLTVGIRGKCDTRRERGDPFDKLSVDCRVEAWETDNAASSFVCAWHLDRIEGTAKEASRHFAHPFYHFQFGGRQLPDNLGEFLSLETPRLAHPPLDAILAVDFVLTNYFPDTWIRLRKDEGYARIVRRAQDRCWYPYARSVAGHWRSDKCPWPAKHVWPQLIDSLDKR